MNDVNLCKGQRTAPESPCCGAGCDEFHTHNFCSSQETARKALKLHILLAYQDTQVGRIVWSDLAHLCQIWTHPVGV